MNEDFDKGYEAGYKDGEASSYDRGHRDGYEAGLGRRYESPESNNAEYNRGFAAATIDMEAKLDAAYLKGLEEGFYRGQEAGYSIH